MLGSAPVSQKQKCEATDTSELHRSPALQTQLLVGSEYEISNINLWSYAVTIQTAAADVMNAFLSLDNDQCHKAGNEGVLTLLSKDLIKTGHGQLFTSWHIICISSCLFAHS